MARQAVWSLAAVLLVAGCLWFANAQKVDVAGSVLAGAKAVSTDSKQGQLLGAAVDQLTSRISASLSGLKDKAKPVLDAVGGKKANMLASLLGPVQDAAESLLDGLSAVRETAEVSLTSFFGLLLDNTKELRKTLEDGNLVIDIVRTLRGAECEEASFEPPALKPAKISGPAGSLLLSTGSCTLKRTADPLTLDYTLECEQPGIEFEAKAPRYTSRFVTAAEASTEECKVVRKYGVESEVVITLFNPADFFAAAEEAGAEVDVEADPAAGGAASRRLGVNAAAGWFKTLFPLLGGGLKDGKKIQFMPRNVIDAVQKAIKEATVDLAVDFKPFTIRQDIVKQANVVAEALADAFEVKQTKYTEWKDDIKQWASSDKKELLGDVDLGGNLREAMAKYNVTNLFDGMFAQTASKLMSKTQTLGTRAAKVVDRLPDKLPGSRIMEHRLTEKPLRTLLGKAREGAGQPVSLKVEAGLESAVSQALDALRTATGDWAKVLPKAPRKGSLMEKLMKDRGAAGHIKELQDIFTKMSNLGDQLGNLRQAAAGVAAESGAAAGISQEGSAAAASADAADAVTGGASSP